MNPHRTEDPGLPPSELRKMIKNVRQTVTIIEALKPLLKQGEQMGPHEQEAVRELLWKIKQAASDAWTALAEHQNKQYDLRRQLNGAVAAAK